MVERVFSGRRRHPVKIVLYSILTLGVYGRVFVYKTLKELDGHEALFLDLKVYRILLILPIIGPLVAKWRLAKLLPAILRHDETASRVHVGGLRWAALIPWFPVFHVLVQLHLNPHWDLHRKINDLAAKREVLSEVLKSRRAADQEQAKTLELGIKRREEELENARQAALALRAAEEARRLAEEEIRKAGGRKKPLKRLVGSLTGRRSGRIEGGPDEAQGEPEESVEKKWTLGRFRGKAVPPAEPASADSSKELPSASRGGGLVGRVFKRRDDEPVSPLGEPEAKAAGEQAPPAGEGLSRKERKAFRKQEKERRKQEKAAEKQRAKDDKARAKEERRAAKEKAKEEKARRKEEEKGADQTPIAELSPATSPPQPVPQEAPPSIVAEGKEATAEAGGKHRKGGPSKSKAKARAR